MVENQVNRVLSIKANCYFRPKGRGKKGWLNDYCYINVISVGWKIECRSPPFSTWHIRHQAPPEALWLSNLDRLSTCFIYVSSHSCRGSKVNNDPKAKRLLLLCIERESLKFFVWKAFERKRRKPFCLDRRLHEYIMDSESLQLRRRLINDVASNMNSISFHADIVHHQQCFSGGSQLDSSVTPLC